MSICLLCGASITAHFAKCPSCGSEAFSLDQATPNTPPVTFSGVKQGFRRRSDGKVIAGVCGGIADRFGISVKAVRVVATIGGFLLPPIPLLVLPVYLFLACTTPTDALETR